VLQIQDFIGGELYMRFNALHPPFDNPAIRRAVLPAINQSEFMTAAFGDDHSLWRDHVGVWSLGKPMSTDAGVEVMAGDRDKARRMQAEAGYRGEKITVLIPGDYPTVGAVATVGADLLARIGFNVDPVTLDYATINQRRNNRATPDKGGWNIFFTSGSGQSYSNPAIDVVMAMSGDKAWYGWPTNPTHEQLRAKWIEAATIEERKTLARQIQENAWNFVPHMYYGQWQQPTAHRKNVAGWLHMPDLIVFWNVTKT